MTIFEVKTEVEEIKELHKWLEIHQVGTICQSRNSIKHMCRVATVPSARMPSSEICQVPDKAAKYLTHILLIYFANQAILKRKFFEQIFLLRIA